ncbi:MAG: tRNA dihydrouridine synthase DusB [Flavobacterium sp. JAD_PAG50586_2]|nr:MAG: tRNA dihydrouridine synthase DusB [Flavobacterium sp. JAD_PAG50586_2]
MPKIGNIQLPDFPLLLAPMEDVSDPPFRRLCKLHGADLMYSEFISSEGLIRDAIKSRMKLDIFDYERPVGIQIFGGDEEAMAMSAKIVETVRPDLVDINFGCPVKKVVCKGAGAGVLKDVDLMVRLTKAVIRSTNLPVTVKTRLGWDESSINIDEVAERLQDIGVQALTVHARTRAQMYKGSADWSHIARVKNNPRITMPIFGNGDIDSPEKALEYKNKYGLDGMMIGRAAIGYPWIFNEIKHYFKTGEHLAQPTMADRIEAARNHLTWSMEWKGERVGIVEMRRHYTNYFKGVSNFKEHRLKLVTLETAESLFRALDEIQEVYADYQFV